ncbi:MAG: extracellular solute-binding protein [Clostridia bacterium]|nr:extracellular solute-binding protein [Clostridia bacterium]
MKKIICLMLVCIMAVSFAGCGKTNETNGDGTVTLKLGLPGGKTVTNPEIVELFKSKHPNIKLEIDETPWSDFKKKLKMQVATSNAPTVFIMDSGYVAALGGMGAAVDLTDRVKRDLNPEEYSIALTAGQDAQGHLWGVPHDLNSVAIYYNKTLFDEANLPYPDENWTYEEMFEMAKKLTKDIDGDGKTDQYGFCSLNNITAGWLPFVTANGGVPLDETRTKSMFKDPKTVEGLRRYIEPVQTGISPGMEWTAANGGAIAAFYMGKVAMLMGLSSAIKNINANAAEGFEYDVQILPIGWDGERHCVYVPNYWTIFSRASEAEQDAAWEWIKFYLSEEAQMLVADEFLAGYPIKHTALEYLNTKESAPANTKVFYQGVEEYGVTLFENKTFEEWRPKVDTITAQMFRGDVTFEEGIDEIDKQVSEALLEE